MVDPVVVVTVRNFLEPLEKLDLASRMRRSSTPATTSNLFTRCNYSQLPTTDTPGPIAYGLRYEREWVNGRGSLSYRMYDIVPVFALSRSQRSRNSAVQRRFAIQPV